MQVLHLFITLFQNFGLIIAAAFLLLSWSSFQRLVLKETTPVDKLILILFFGTFGILGSYAGVPIQGAIANLRASSVITAGLFGGPLVGFGAGIIAGGHRVLIDVGGFTSIPCGLATVLEGLVAGWVATRLARNSLDWRAAFSIGLLGETFHMGTILAIARPFTDALALVKIIALPMIFMNAIGAALFVKIIRSVLKDQERQASLQAQKALDIANRTVSHLRSGLTRESAHATARIILKETSVAAVSITDDSTILAYVGAGLDHNSPGEKIRTATTFRVLETGRPAFLRNKNQIGCNESNCPIHSTIVVPLRKSDQIVGTLKLHGDQDNHLNKIDLQIALGLANLFSTQLELEDIQIQAQLLSRAEIKHLQSQINPHFLFNSLNTIASFCRTNSDRARELILELANYLRRNIRDNRHLISLSEELEQVKSYLAIEKARFGDRIQFTIDVEPDSEGCLLPPLVIQPLVENAVKHGIAGQEQDGLVQVGAVRSNGYLDVWVQDNGIGISPVQLDEILRKDGESMATNCIGLKNVNRRLEHLYGPQYKLKIDSRPQAGTVVFFRVPSRKL